MIALLASACGANLAGEPEIVATLPPMPTPTEGAAAQDVGLPATQPDIAQGAAIFANNCTSCHGAQGAGNGELVVNGQVPNPGNMTDRAAVAVDNPQDWFSIITNGNLENLMPPWAGSLSEQERWSVAMYTYTLSYTPEEIAAGEAVFSEHFAGFDGLALDDPQTMVALTDEELRDTLVGATDSDLSDDELWSAVAYARTQSLTGVDAVGQVAEPDAVADASAGANPAAAPLSAPTTATINGTIVNSTMGGELPSGDTPITLYVLSNAQQQGMGLVDSFETTSADGAFTFEDVTIDPTYTYVAIVPYRDRQFISEPLRGSNAAIGEDGTLALPVEIHELTDDKSVIEIERMVMQITAQESGLQVVQVAAFRNTSDRMFTSSQALNEDGTQFGSTVMFLPPGAVPAGMTDPQRYIYSEEDFAVIDTQPVLPTTDPGSEHIMQAVYFLPYEDGAIIEHALPYDVEGTVRVLVSPQALDLTSEQLETMGAVNLGAAVYAEYGSAVNLVAGDVMRYELSGDLDRVLAAAAVPGGSSSGERWRILPTVLFAISGVTGAVAIGLFVYGRVNDSGKQTNREIDKLVAQIAELDAAHEAGTLNHDLWHQQRNELKARLKLLMESTSTPTAEGANA